LGTSKLQDVGLKLDRNTLLGIRALLIYFSGDGYQERRKLVIDISNSLPPLLLLFLGPSYPVGSSQEGWVIRAQDLTFLRLTDYVPLGRNLPVR
jgi:hypothetical protein